MSVDLASIVVTDDALDRVQRAVDATNARCGDAMPEVSGMITTLRSTRDACHLTRLAPELRAAFLVALGGNDAAR